LFDPNFGGLQRNRTMYRKEKIVILDLLRRLRRRAGLIRPAAVALFYVIFKCYSVLARAGPDGKIFRLNIDKPCASM
jgi:hypothetical protein